MDQIRQGDVLLFRLPGLPRRAKRQEAGEIRIAGELTGHAHVLPGLVWTLGQRLLVELPAPSVITHQEHRHVEVPAGVWEVRTQREHVPDSRPTRRWD